MEEQAADEKEKSKFINFLKHYDLGKHYESFVKIGVHKLSHLKHTTDEDLVGIGLSRPEANRLRKKLDENFSTFGKFKKKLSRKDHKFDPSEGKLLSGTAMGRSGKTNSPSPTDLTGHPDSPVLISSSQIKLLKKIGEGTNGAVHEADLALSDHKLLKVAVKCITTLNELALTQFMKEAESMVQLNHTHIIKLYGISIGTTPMIIEELAPLGDLNSYLKTNAEIHLGHLYKFMLDIGSAMCYLEEKRIVHRDLATRNVLVSTPDLVKLGDFGLARKLTEYGDYQLRSNVPLPAAWMSPEAFNKGVFSSASDVWSFGVCVWELYSKGEKPWNGYRGVEIMDRLDTGERLRKPNICPPLLYQLLNDCWALEPYMRPSFAYLLKKLQEPQYRPEVALVLQSHSVDNDLLLNKEDLLFVVDKCRHNDLGVGMTTRGEVCSFRMDLVKIDSMRINKDQHVGGAISIPVEPKKSESCGSTSSRSSSVITGSNSNTYDSPPGDLPTNIPAHYETYENNPGAFEERRDSHGGSAAGDRKGVQDKYLNESPLPSSDGDYRDDDDDMYIKMQPGINILDTPTEVHLPPPLSPTPPETTPKTDRILPFDTDQDNDHPKPSSGSSPKLDFNADSLYCYLSRSQNFESSDTQSRTPPPVPPRLPPKTPSNPTTHGSSPPIAKPRSQQTLFPRTPEATAHPTFKDDKDLFEVLFKEFPDIDRTVFNKIASQCEWEGEKIREKLKIRQLMGMHFPYIDENDCIRALDHCQGKTERAAAWLIEQSETISARRTQH